MKKRIAIFASGSGTNAQKIISYFEKHESIEIGLVVCNKEGAGVFDIAKKAIVESKLIDKNHLGSNVFIEELVQENIEYIVLAGFLLLIPQSFIKAFEGNIINIHPSLLPKFGGKGMYGMNVHQAVKDAEETKTGITIHLVDEVFDHGKVIFQKTVQLSPSDDAQAIAKKVQVLEHEWYPTIIEEWINHLSS